MKTRHIVNKVDLYLSIGKVSAPVKSKKDNNRKLNRTEVLKQNT
jgi:hypothetical protein